MRTRKASSQLPEAFLIASKCAIFHMHSIPSTNYIRENFVFVSVLCGVIMNCIVLAVQPVVSFWKTALWYATIWINDKTRPFFRWQGPTFWSSPKQVLVAKLAYFWLDQLPARNGKTRRFIAVDRTYGLRKPSCWTRYYEVARTWFSNITRRTIKTLVRQ